MTWSGTGAFARLAAQASVAEKQSTRAKIRVARKIISLAYLFSAAILRPDAAKPRPTHDSRSFCRHPVPDKLAIAPCLGAGGLRL
jgi:hypothetical protein